MKKYAYFPGCSLESMERSYHQSTLETAKALGVDLQELEDWNCCGATAYFHVDEFLAYALCARNLAMADKEKLDVVAPCSACFKNMYFTREHLKEDADLAEHVNEALQEDNLKFTGAAKVRHLLEVFVQDVGLEAVKKAVKKPLKGLRVATYYGCQMVRPRKAQEEIERPRYFEDLVAALGAEPVDFQWKLRCCGGSLIVTNRQAALAMIRELLEECVRKKADLIVTSCPLCQVNLECYQGHVNGAFGTNLSIPVLFFTQLMGVALGVAPDSLGIGKELVSAEAALGKVAP
jgi:heterodisulfide reductase subunit B